jgi:predicted phosphodiesterase
MKLAVLSDIHGNLPALQTVANHIERWRPDYVIVNGDVINRGPKPLECLQFVNAKRQSHDWLVTHGNHEGYVLSHAGSTAVPHTLHLPSYWTCQQLNGDVATIQNLPAHLGLMAPDGAELRVCHASMRGHRDGIYEDTAVSQVRQQIAPPPAVFCTGHIHQPFLRQVDDTLIVNVGSVGAPCDGDIRASYAQVEWVNGRWQAQIIRLDYDRQQTIKDFETSGFFDGCGPIAHLIYPEWLTAHMCVVPWRLQYETAVLAGEIDLATSVSQFLQPRPY